MKLNKIERIFAGILLALFFMMIGANIARSEMSRHLVRTSDVLKQRELTDEEDRERVFNDVIVTITYKNESKLLKVK